MDYFLKLDGIPGESNDDRHRDEIDVLAFSWGESNEGSFGLGSGAGAGKVHAEDFFVAKPVDKSSSRLMVACATGEHIKTAVLSVRKAGAQQAFLTYTMKEVQIASYHVGADADEPSPIDDLSLAFAMLTVSYRPQRQDGSLGAAVTHTFDFARNKKG